MEKLGDILARWIRDHRADMKRFLGWLEGLSLDQRSLLLIVLGLLPPGLYLHVSGSIPQGMVAFLLPLALLYAMVMVVTLAWYKAKDKGERWGFSFKKLDPGAVDHDFFAFDPRDRGNLADLLKGMPLEGRINIRELGRNKEGNLRFLFTFLDLALRGGIRDLDPRSRTLLSQFITESFTLNGSPINANTLPSSYSKWNTITRQGGYDAQRRSMALALALVEFPPALADSPKAKAQS